MNKKWTASLTALLVGMTTAAWADEPVLKSTMEDQTGVELTVYNGNLGLVKDTRTIDLSRGEGELRFMDVAASIMPVTVSVKSLNQPEGFTVLEQNYEYDLMSPDKLLDKFVGRKIKLIDRNEFQGTEKVVEAELLSNNGSPIYKIGDQIFLGHPGYRVLSEIPENLIAKPTLTWLYSNKGRKSHDVEVSYLTNNISWKADYVVILNDSDTQADLSGWVTVNNQSGAIYKEAKLKLIAGQINRAINNMPQVRYAMEAMAAGATAADSFVEQAFFEYHIYDLQRKTTIKNNQTKQISLLAAEGAGVQKEMLVYGEQGYFTRRYHEQNPKQPVNVYVKIKNSEANKLGMPLPAGVMRLYKKDGSGSLQFIGEDNVEHTPKEEQIKLKVGEAFDVVAERRQTDWKEIASDVYESEWEITLRNHKKEDVTVSLIEPLYGTWQVLNNSHPFTKEDAFTIRFDVPVAKDKEVKVIYRIRVQV